MRVLLLCHGLPPDSVGGVEQHTSGLAAALAAAGHEVHTMITFPDETRRKMVGIRDKRPKPLLGTMANVDGQRVQFTWSGERSGLSADQARQLFFAGGDIELKFQVKMIKRGFFDVVATVDSVEPAGDSGIRITARFQKIAEADRDALSQFAADMAFLKNQLPSS